MEFTKRLLFRDDHYYASRSMAALSDAPQVERGYKSGPAVCATPSIRSILPITFRSLRGCSCQNRRRSGLDCPQTIVIFSPRRIFRTSLELGCGNQPRRYLRKALFGSLFRSIAGDCSMDKILAPGRDIRGRFPARGDILLPQLAPQQQHQISAHRESYYPNQH